MFWKKRCSYKSTGKFTGKHLCQSLFFNKVAGQRPKACNLIKKRDFGTGVFLSICKFCTSSFFMEHLWLTASGYEIGNCNIWLVWIKNSFHSWQWQYKILWTVCKNPYEILKYSCNYPYKVLSFLEILAIFLRSFWKILGMTINLQNMV